MRRFVPQLSVTLAPCAGGAPPRVVCCALAPAHTSRLQREFGAARVAFVSVSVPSGGAARGAASRALAAAAAAGFAAGGRRWAWLHGKYRASTAVFFAEEGAGLVPMSVDEVRAWHIPPGLNSLPPHKFGARMDLALSKAVPVGAVGEGAAAAPPPPCSRWRP